MKFLQSRNLLRSCEFAVAGLITVVVVLLHIRFCWSTGPLWRDEVCTFNVATTPTLQDSWGLLTYDNHPLLHYLILRAWCALGFGSTDIGLRLLGLIIGLFLTAAIWIACWIFNKSPPLWALTIFGLNEHTFRADSLRSHGLGLIWVVLSFAFIWQLTFEEEPKKRTLFLAAAAAVLSVQTVFPNILIIAAFCIASAAVLVMQRGRRRMAAPVGIAFLAALSLLPYLTVIQQGKQCTSIRAVALSLKYIASAFVQIATIGEPIAGSIFFALVLGGLVSGIVQRLRRPIADSNGRAGQHFLFAAVASLTVAIGTFVFLWVLKFPLQDRYYLPLLAVIALSVTISTVALRRFVAVRLFSLVVSIILAAALFRHAVDYTKMRLTNCDVAAAAVSTIAEPDDVIVLTRFGFGITFQRYYRGSVAWHGIPDISDYRLFRWDLVKQAMTETDPMHELLVRIELALSSGHNVFVVGQFGPLPVAQPQPLPPAPLTTYRWDMEAYLARWNEQVSYLIDQHARNGQTISLPEKDRVDLLERVNVYVFSGWR